jgi:hypothetical protein
MLTNHLRKHYHQINTGLNIYDLKITVKDIIQMMIKTAA